MLRFREMTKDLGTTCQPAVNLRYALAVPVSNSLPFRLPYTSGGAGFLVLASIFFLQPTARNPFSQVLVTFPSFFQERFLALVSEIPPLFLAVVGTDSLQTRIPPPLEEKRLKPRPVCEKSLKFPTPRCYLRAREDRSRLSGRLPHRCLVSFWALQLRLPV